MTKISTVALCISGALCLALPLAAQAQIPIEARAAVANRALEQQLPRLLAQAAPLMAADPVLILRPDRLQPGLRAGTEAGPGRPWDAATERALQAAQDAGRQDLRRVPIEVWLRPPPGVPGTGDLPRGKP